MRKIIHIDMDCFFAAVEMRDNPALRDIPLAIGGEADRRGVIATCNYVARRFGIHSAMATAHARRLCPSLTVLPGRMAVYQQVSAALRAIFERYTDRIEPLSLDEAYLDVSDSPLYQGSATRMAEAIRADIRRELQLTASAGVAPNKFLAKIASDLNKPDGLFVLAPEQVAAFVAALPLRKIPGVGQKSAERLAALGLHTGADVQGYPASELLRLFGKQGQMLLARAHGIDERPLSTSREPKSISRESTFSRDLHARHDRAELSEIFTGMCLRVADDLARQGYVARTIGIKLRYADFQSVTRDLTLAVPTADGAAIRKAAGECLKRVPLQQRLRLLGVRASSLLPAAAAAALPSPLVQAELPL